jgi:hypothetical protein
VPPPVVGEGPLGPFVNDPTLRAGDVVVTAKGIMVYRGSAQAHHSDGDFVPVAEAAKIGGERRRDLAQIERVNKRAPRITPIVAAAPGATQLADASQSPPSLVIKRPARKTRHH